MNKQNRQAVLTDIIKFILAKGLVHYNEIEDYVHKSRKTVAKYLDEIEEEIAKSNINVKLIRRRNHGIYFNGDISQLMARYDVRRRELDRDSRLIDILHFLLTSNKQMTLIEVSEMLFISQSTLEKDLDYLRRNFGVQLSSNNQGIILDLSEDEIRKLLSAITKKSINSELNYDEMSSKFSLNFDVPDTLRAYINTDTLNLVQKALADFIQFDNPKINEYEYEALLVHISIAIQRIRDGDFIGENIVERELHPNTVHLVKILEKYFDIHIPKSEKQYLNLHILAIEGEEIDIDNNVIDSKIISLLEKSLVNYDITLISNLAVHLRSVVKRAAQGISITNPYALEIKTQFLESFDLARDLMKTLSYELPLIINDDEISYVAMHFQSFKERIRKELNNKVSILLICSTGYGTAVFLSQRLKELFGDRINIAKTISVEELSRKNIKADLIISTIPIKSKRENILQISPLIKENELEILKRLIGNIQDKKEKMHNRNAFMKLINKNSIFIGHSRLNKEQAIKLIASKLCSEGYVSSEMECAALKREALASTKLDNVAIPHGDIKYVNHPVIGVLVNQNGIIWDKTEVKVVFFIALNKEIDSSMDDIYSYFYDMISDQKRIEELGKLEKIIDIYNFLGGEVK